MPALDYLRTMAAHRLVFQLDQSSVPGQVAGDALLCRIPCVGGNGTAERIVFPGLCGHGRSTGELLDLTKRLLTDDSFCKEAMRVAVEQALDKMCFMVAQRELRAFSHICSSPIKKRVKKLVFSLLRKKTLFRRRCF